MNRKYTIFCYLIIAASFIFAQGVSLITASDPPSVLRDWFVRYQWTSSIELFGLAFLSIFAVLCLWRFPCRVVYWLCFLITLFIAQISIGLELWAHYVEVPKKLVGTNISMTSYFSFTHSLAVIPRLLWHIIIPITLVLNLYLIAAKEVPSRPPV